MKRVKESGAAFRQKKKAREALLKKDEGALLRYIHPKETATNTDQKSTKTENLCELKPLSDSEDPDDSSTTSDHSDSDVKHEPRQEENIPAVHVNNLQDIGQWPNKINNDTRIFLIRQGASLIQNVDFHFTEVIRQGTSTKGQTRNLTRDWFFKSLPNGEKILRSWMIYSPSKTSIYCFCCKLFAEEGSCKSSFNSPDGFNTWWKLNPKVSQHESNASHVQNFTNWKEMEIRIASGKTIDKMEQEVVENKKKQWKSILSRLLDIIRFLAKQNLSLRGHREDTHTEAEVAENKGNFLELVYLLSKYDPVLREHILRIQMGSKYTASYLSPTIQNEFIEILGENVRSKIINQVKEAKYFSMIFDSTPDISHKDQMSQVLRYVVIDGDQVKVVESFVDFIEAKGKTAENIATMILEKLKNDGIDIKNCRGQAYDNAAVMAGQHSGVQKRIKEINPKAEFVACTNHSLNLAGVHAASVAVNSVTFFGTVERVFTFFSSSTHRWDVLSSVIGQGVKRIIETRWSARGDAVSVVKRHFSEIIGVLEKLTGEEENIVTRSEAGLLLGALQSFPFLCFLGLWEPVLREINDTQAYLQTKGLNVQQCDIKLGALEEFLVKNREELVNDGINYAKEVCDDLNIVMERQRRSRKKKHIFGDGSQAAGLPYDIELKAEMFSSLDRVIQEINSRFKQLHELAKKYIFLTPTYLIDEQYECQLTDINHDDIDKNEFLLERKRLQRFIAVATSQGETNMWKEGPLELLQFINKYNLGNSVPNIVVMLRIFLTVAISVATCERSFSKLKLIKSYLRSTMSTLRVRNLGILSIERQLTEQIDFDKVIEDFANKKARKIFL